MPELKPCPFCGKEDVFTERADYSSSFVQCNSCCSRGPVECQESDEEEVPGEKSAIKAWNCRAPSPIEEAATMLLKKSPFDCGDTNFYFCIFCGNQEPNHEPDCPWLALQRAVEGE